MTDVTQCTATEREKTLCLDERYCACHNAMKEKQDIERENNRMITAFESIQRIADDMLDPIRRAGPTSK